MYNDTPNELKKLIRITEVLRDRIGHNISLAVVHTFLLAVQHPDEGVVDLTKRLKTNKATVSRHLLDLSEKLRTGEPGYGVLKRMPDQPDLREVRYSVTPKGAEILNSLSNILTD